MKRRVKKSVIAKFIIFICLIGVCYSCWDIYKWKKDVDDNARIKKRIDNGIKIVKEKEYSLDFDSLKKQNSDAVAYVKVNGTNIDYVVVKGDDNSYYLNHNFDKKYNNAGWIFADYRNKFDESDRNIIIYGHNTKDGSMFGTLENVLDEKWYGNSENHKVVLITEDNTYYYEVFSTYSVASENYYINTSFKDNDEFDKFVGKLKSRSIYNYDTDVNGEDKILTLSSCLGDGKKRVVLHAKLIQISV